LVAFVTLLCAGIAVLITALTPKTYEATTTVYVASNLSAADPTSNYGGVIAAQYQAATFADIVTSKKILDQVRIDLNLAMSDDELSGKISASAPAQRSLVNITVQDNSADEAAAIANSVAKAFVNVIEDDNRPDGGNASTVKLTQTVPAQAPSSASEPQPVLNIALGFVIGLLLGIALAVARDVLDRRIKDPDTLEKVAGVPSMGVIIDDPKTSRHPIATRAGTRNQRAENFRQLRANLQFANVDQHPRVIAITSSIPGEGKTTAAINLASTLAEAGFTVCLVDADLRRPSVGKALGLPGSVGLTSVLIHQIGVMEALQSAGSSLYVLTSGPTPPNPSEVLASSYVRDVIRSLLDHVDYVVLDTAPLLPVADGSEVAALADGSLLVVRYSETTDAQVKRALQSLRRVDAKVLGAVLNRVPVKRNKGEYGYSYYRTENTKPARPRAEESRSAKKESVS
jgi:non-specific protein-tyrosine kinase